MVCLANSTLFYYSPLPFDSNKPLKTFGPSNYFPGLQITPTNHGLILTQTKYATDVLHCFHMYDAKPIKSPCCYWKNIVCIAYKTYTAKN